MNGERPARATPAVQIGSRREPAIRIVTRQSDTERFIEGRERILGRHHRRHVHADVATGELLEELGPRLALEYALELVAELKAAG
jgi:hypothetical protein